MYYNEIKQLDGLFQVIGLERCKRLSLFGGYAECVHHFIGKNQGYSCRWWLPNGVPMNAKDHNDIHLGNENGKELEKIILNLKGEDWAIDLNIRNRKIVKNLKKQTVLDYFNGKIKDYI